MATRWHYLAFGLALTATLSLAAACGSKEVLTADQAWTTYCARCHAEDGTGDPRSKHLNPKLDIVGSEMLQTSARHIAYRRIQHGYGSMPAFGHKLSHEEIDALVDYCIERFGTPTIESSQAATPPTEPRR